MASTTQINAALTPDSSPRCAVDIYIPEGGHYSLTSAEVLECTTTQKLSNMSAGQASIILAPGGPNGQNYPSWAQIITLQALVIIAMSRGQNANVVFVGIVKSVQEDQVWVPEQGVVRNTRIEAVDWGAWFRDFNWSPLSFLAVVNGNALENAVGQNPDQGIPNILFSGTQSTNPAQIAYNWYSQIQAGSKGILSQTQIRYQNYTLGWPSATTAFFEDYPFGAIWPMSTFYVSQAGTWLDKYNEILQSPWYEVIIGTAPLGAWNPALQANTSSGTVSLKNGGSAWYSQGAFFTSSGMPNAIPASPQIVGRVNPLPDLTATQTLSAASQGLVGQPAFQYTGIDTSRWQQLPAYGLDPAEGFIESMASLDLAEYYNFFILNPTFYAPFMGGAAPGIFMYAYSGAINVAGIHRYGLKSMVRDTTWMVDSNYQIAQSNPASAMQSLVGALTTRMATIYTPLPVMESAQMTSKLLPNIFVGGRFRYFPFRATEEWEFYIHSVTHSWRFGGPSTTTLGLERGLPASVYANTTVLQQVLAGNAMRLNGTVVSGLPAGSSAALQTVGMADSSLKTVLGQVATIYATPGAA